MARESVADLDDDGDAGDGPSEGPSDGNDDGGNDDGGGGTVGPLEPGQWYLFAVDTVVLPGSPLQFVALASRTPDTQQIEVRVEPLSLDLGSTTEPRERLEGSGFVTAVDEPDGAYILRFPPDYDLEGAANPITGSDIVVGGLVLSTPTTPDALCGIADGMLVSPISQPLTGSTFSAIPIADPNQLPVDFPCAGEGPDEMCFTGCDTLGDYTAG